MFNSLAAQYLFQTPDYHPFTLEVGCISGCVSGISLVLKLGHCVLSDKTIIRQTLSSNSSTTKNLESAQMLLCLRQLRKRKQHIPRGVFHRNIVDVLNRSRFMVAVLLEVF